MTPYEILNVARDATPEAIRAAYLLAAKHAHPDAPGGSAEQFSAVKEAYEVLSDPDLRRRFDETGVVIDIKALAAEAAREALTQALNASLEHRYLDLVAYARSQIDTDIRKAEAAGRRAETDLVRDLALLDRCSGDVLITLIRSRIEMIRNQQKSAALSLEILKAAKALIADYVCAPPPTSSQERGGAARLQQRVYWTTTSS